jgi:hypothetical protein
MISIYYAIPSKGRVRQCDREFVSAPALGSMRRVAVMKHKDNNAAGTE